MMTRISERPSQPVDPIDRNVAQARDMLENPNPLELRVQASGILLTLGQVVGQRDHWRDVARRLGEALLEERRHQWTLHGSARTTNREWHDCLAAITRLDGPNSETYKLALEAVRESGSSDDG